MKSNRYSLVIFIFYGAISLAVGYFMAFKFSGGVVEQNQLSQSSGTVRYLKKERAGKYSDVLRFGLANQDIDFQYISKAGKSDVVYSALQKAGHATVLVLYEKDGGFSPLWDERTYYTVYSVRVGDNDVRSYSEVQKSWNSDDKIGFWAGLVFMAIGVIFVLCAMPPNKWL